MIENKIILWQIYAAYNIHVILNEGPIWNNALSFTFYTLQVTFEVIIISHDPSVNLYHSNTVSQLDPELLGARGGENPAHLPPRHVYAQK